MHPATPARPVTAPALELCPPKRFGSALRLVLNHHTNGTRSALMHIGGPAAVERRYAGEAYGNARCLASPMLPGTQTQWPLTASSHHLLINAGTGTTGTRWLHCILENLGVRSVHNNARMAACTRNCTARWDEHEFISDSPIPWQVCIHQLSRSRSAAMRHTASCPRADLAATRDAPGARPRHERRPLKPKRCVTVPCTEPRGQLIAAAHVGWAAAGVILTVRDPEEWRLARIGGHPSMPISAGAVENAGCMNVGRARPTLGEGGPAFILDRV